MKRLALGMRGAGKDGAFVTLSFDTTSERRVHERHAADMPIEVRLQDIVTHRTEYLSEISFGGLSFRSHTALAIGTHVDIRIPLVRPVFHASARVVWCRPDADNTAVFDVGVEFVGAKDNFRARMLEQVCHIENFKKELAAQKGAPVSGEEAALEWIRRYADKFPHS